MPFADIFSGPPASRTRSTAARHRASRRPASWFDAAAAAAAAASASTGSHRDSAPSSASYRRTSRLRRPMSTSGAPPPSNYHHTYSTAPPSAAPTTTSSAMPHSLSPGSDADVLVRGVALSIAAITLAVIFLNVALHVALIAAALVVPAWRTFKAVEAGPHSAPTVVEILDEDDIVLDVDEDDDDPTDADYRPRRHAHDTDDELDEDDEDDVTADGAPRAAPGRTRAAPPPRFSTAAPSDSCPARTGGDATVWQKYWAMTGLLFGFHALVLRPVLGVVVPGTIYRMGALTLFLWLNGNGGNNAASMYEGVVRPLLLKSETAVDAAAASLTDRADEGVRRALCAVNSVISPYVQQLETAAQTARARMEEAERARVTGRGYFD